MAAISGEDGYGSSSGRCSGGTNGLASSCSRRPRSCAQARFFTTFSRLRGDAPYYQTIYLGRSLIRRRGATTCATSAFSFSSRGPRTGTRAPAPVLRPVRILSRMGPYGLASAPSFSPFFTVYTTASGCSSPAPKTVAGLNCITHFVRAFGGPAHLTNSS